LIANLPGFELGLRDTNRWKPNSEHTDGHLQTYSLVRAVLSQGKRGNGKGYVYIEKLIGMLAKIAVKYLILFVVVR
jgi:hypothetical protein